MLDELLVNGHAKLRSSGRYTTATTQGTARWMLADRCDGTYIRVYRKVVRVTDFIRHKTILVRAGHRYLTRRR